MATYYVWSGAVGSNNGSSWANAFTTLTTAFATEVAGDTLYVAHDHAQTAAVNTALTSSGTITNPTRVICVNRAGSVPPVSADRRATATVTTTSNFNLTIDGCAHYDGIIFSAGTGASSSANLILATSNNEMLRFDNCSLRLGITTGASTIYVGGSGGFLAGVWIELNNTTMSFAATSHALRVVSVLRWRNTPSALLGTLPTTLFVPWANAGGAVECFGVDLSALGSGKTIFSASGNNQSFKLRLMDCKLDAAVTKTNTPAGFGTAEIDFVRCDSSGVNYSFYKRALAGTLDHEATIVRTGGASDGTTAIAWKIVTTANSNYSTPFECPPIAIWNDTVGSAVTATVEGVASALPTDQECWLDVEYLGDASSPQGSFANDGKADLLATAANQTTSTATWGGALTGKFKLEVLFTAQQKGWIYARVKCGKASSTFYIDPLVTLT